MASKVISLTLAVAGFTVAGSTAGAQNTPAPPPARVAFVGASIISMADSGGGVLRDHTLVIRDHVIEQLGPSASTPVPPDATVVDARGTWIMPGLIDAHVHLEYFADPSVLTLFLASGVTSVRNMDGRPFILDWRRQVEQGTLLGPSIHTAGPIIDGKPPVRDDNLSVADSLSAAAAVREQRAAGYDFIKLYSGLSADAYRGAVAEAKTLGLAVAGHAPRRMPIDSVIVSGQTSIEHLTDFDDAVEADSSSVAGRFHWSKLYLAMGMDRTKATQVAERAARAGVWVVPTMIQAERAVVDSVAMSRLLYQPSIGLLPKAGIDAWTGQAIRTASRLDSSDWKVVNRGRENRSALIRVLYDKGVKIAVGTDTPNPFVMPGTSVYDEMQLLADAGLPPAAVLAAATRNAAKLMNTNDRGTVEVGKRADLVVLAGNPLEELRYVRHPLGVVANGRWLPGEDLVRKIQPLVLTQRN